MQNMPNASSRRGTVLLICMGLVLLAIVAVAVFSEERAKADAFAARGYVLALPDVPVPGGEIDVNTADVETLMLLPGVGGAVAMEIIREREANGPFHYPEDLLAVKGIGTKKLEALLPSIRLDDKP